MLPGWVALRMGRSPCGEKRFFFCGEAEVFYLAVGFCLLGWGVPLAGKPPFHLPARREPQSSRWGQAVSWWLCRLETARALWVLCRLTDGGVALAGKITFLPARRGPKPLFLFREKKTAVLDSEKEKGDQWRLWRGTVQPDVGFVLLWYPSGERLWGVLPVSGGMGLSDP